MNSPEQIEPRLIAHHVGARGYDVSFIVPARFRSDVVHVLYEADRECVERLLRVAHSATVLGLSERHIFPYCLGRTDGPATLNITANAYASSILEPNPGFLRYYNETPIDGAFYDVTYPEMLRVVRKVEVEMRSLDRLFDEGLIPATLRPDFLSLDTQGYELEILQGARQTVTDGVLAVVCEVEMLPMYVGQPLLADILQQMTRSDFVFAGFTALHEVAPMRAPVGLRGKGFPGFGDALFLRDLDKLSEASLSADRAHAMFLKAAFIALSFGHVEYALDALRRAGQLRERVSPALLAKLESMRYVDFLHRVATVARRRPSMYPPLHAVTDDSRQPADARTTSWYDKYHQKALKPLQPRVLLRSPLARAVRRLLPDWIAMPLRRLLIRHAFPEEKASVIESGGPTATAPQWGRMQEYTDFEKLLYGCGFRDVMQIVRQRRIGAERFIRALDPQMYRDGAFVHLPRE